MKEFIVSDDSYAYEMRRYDELEELVRCKDCKHRPKHSGDKGNGFDIEFPDEISPCPCQCDDPWFNWMPKDEWYCANGERREE